ncbi:thiamine pyrophosphate-binding protein [Streptomyces sp. NPDC094438]|uniref:thiamine pyrophosphate-binding protein n=1 Tax=Streptomyces sp. NPDC094438 TaxID=3366061 RepID=UPI0037FB70F0
MKQLDADGLERSVGGGGKSNPLAGLFHRSDGSLDAIACAETLISVGPDAGREEIAEFLLRSLGEAGFAASRDQLSGIARHLADEIAGTAITLTGAESVALLLEHAGTYAVFAYAGTSELALCDSCDRAAALRLMNGRGDKESAFMAAGASLLQPRRGAAILHGARGLTNAAGAVADARRNEAGTVFIVGLPSTGSAAFLPPHGEAGLLPAIGTFTDWWWQAPAVPEDGQARARAAYTFVNKFTEALAASARLPARPAMFGIPQDVAERRWIPFDAVLSAPTGQPVQGVGKDAPAEAVDLLRQARRPLFLVDDYALRFPEFAPALDGLTRALGAPVLQLRYRRGPMLFERLRPEHVANFIGWYNQFSTAHAALLNECDLLVTVEDRNIYRRVVGDLPPCRKIALTGDGPKARKNGYLTEDDLLVEGDVTALLRSLTEGLKRGSDGRRWFADSTAKASCVTPEPAGELVEHMRTRVVDELARTLRGWDRPVLIDDSQMFGGLISERYDLLPPELRVFGGHGGFVGGGLACAVGLAVADPGCRVLCTLGDQGFTNAFQGLVAAVQEKARVLFVVCNNGESVSLKKQASASDPTWFGGGTRPYLTNPPTMDYTLVAEALGVPSQKVRIVCGPNEPAIDQTAEAMGKALAEAAQTDGPALVELLLPAEPEAWLGIWLTQGFEQQAPERN